MTNLAPAPKAPATEAQLNYLTTLLSQRVIPEGYTDLLILVGNQSIGKLEASMFIDKLRSAPWKPRGHTPIPSQGHLSEVPVARYAISFEEFGMFLPEIKQGANDFLFFRISEFRGRRRISRLHGAPGAFTTSYIPQGAAKGLVNLIKGDPAKYSRKFGELFTCCGACLAPLTDPESRAVGFGPTCRARFGL